MCLGDVIAFRAMDIYSEYSLLARASSKNPMEVWGAVAESWIPVFGPPRTIQADAGGTWKNETWADFCTERNIRPRFQGQGGHPWLFERRNGLALGIYDRPAADDRFRAARFRMKCSSV